MKKNIIYMFLTIAIFGIASGCRKDDFEGTDSLGLGPSYVKLLEAPSNALYFTPFTTIKEKVHLFSVRREASGPDALNTSNTVVLTADAAAITKYNTDNGTDYELLPESIYTLAVDAGVTKTATGYTVAFKPGDFSKNIKINLNGGLWNLSKKYAVAFNVSDAGGLTKASGKTSIIVLISIKNAYDGVYDVNGTLTDANGLYKGDYPRQFSLTTASATSVKMYDIDYDFDRYIVINNAGTSAANTGIALQYTFDPVTNKLVSVTDPVAPTRVFTNVDGEFKPGDRSITIQWTSGRWSAKESWTFVKDR